MRWSRRWVLLPASPKTTAITLGSSSWQTARGELSKDASGGRTATVLFPAGVSAKVTAPDGATTSLAKGTFRLTEYTVGDRGPQAMPGDLPPLSGYTYASEFTLDEAKGGAVAFDRPVVVYLDNSLGFPVGTTIPAGAYESGRGAWSTGESGKVVKVLADGAGVALDATGDDVADPADAAELTELAKTAKVGDVFWRVALRHFSPWDLNLGFSPRKDAQQPPPGTKGGANSTEEPQTCPGGSWFECENQVLGETLPIVGRVSRSRTGPTGYAEGPLPIPSRYLSLDSRFHPRSQQCADIGWDRAGAAAIDGAIGGLIAGAVTKVPSSLGPRFPWGNLVRGAGDPPSAQLARGFWTPRSGARIGVGAAFSNSGTTPPAWFSGASPPGR